MYQIFAYKEEPKILETREGNQEIINESDRRKDEKLG